VAAKHEATGEYGRSTVLGVTIKGFDIHPSGKERTGLSTDELAV
jgi:hypothetical protein